MLQAGVQGIPAWSMVPKDDPIHGKSVVYVMGEQLQAKLGSGDAVKPNCEVEIYGLHTTSFVVSRMSSNLRPISGGVPRVSIKPLILWVHSAHSLNSDSAALIKGSR